MSIDNKITIDSSRRAQEKNCYAQCHRAASKVAQDQLTSIFELLRRRAVVFNLDSPVGVYCHGRVDQILQRRALPIQLPLPRMRGCGRGRKVGRGGPRRRRRRRRCAWRPAARLGALGRRARAHGPPVPRKDEASPRQPLAADVIQRGLTPRQIAVQQSQIRGRQVLRRRCDQRRGGRIAAAAASVVVAVGVLTRKNR